jgi:hypothetical protein
MASGVDFMLLTKGTAGVAGTSVKAPPFVVAADRVNARMVAGRVPGGTGTGLLGPTGQANNGNFYIGGFADAGFAKNGCYHKTTTGTTAVNVDYTDLTAGATSSTGDTSFASVNKVTVMNCGTADMTVGPGGSNPANFPKFAGTGPTLTLAAGCQHSFEVGTPATVDATHKILTITPTAGGDVMVAVGGA